MNIRLTSIICIGRSWHLVTEIASAREDPSLYGFLLLDDAIPSETTGVYKSIEVEDGKRERGDG